MRFEEENLSPWNEFQSAADTSTRTPARRESSGVLRKAISKQSIEKRNSMHVKRLKKAPKKLMRSCSMLYDSPSTVLN